MRKEGGETGSGSCVMVRFDISGDEASGSVTTMSGLDLPR